MFMELELGLLNVVDHQYPSPRICSSFLRWHREKTLGPSFGRSPSGAPDPFQDDPRRGPQPQESHAGAGPTVVEEIRKPPARIRKSHTFGVLDPL